MNSSPVMVSFSRRYPARAWSLSSFSRSRARAFWWAALTVATTCRSISAAVSAEQAREVSPPRYWLVTVSRATMSNWSVMP